MSPRQAVRFHNAERRQIMFRCKPKPERSRKQSCSPCAEASSWLPAVLLAAGLTSGTVVQEAHAAPARAQPFKVANIHFETNASACDMGIQIIFDTDGITGGSVTGPNGLVYSFESKGGMTTIGGQTEGFLEGVEPQITELLSALGCRRSREENVISLQALFDAWPDGDYTLKGTRNGAIIAEGHATLTHFIPAGPEILAPLGTVVDPDAALLIDWNAVTAAILTPPNLDLGPVDIVGYHVVVVETGAEALPQLDVDVPASETSLTVPAQYLNPGTVYAFEVLATDASGNQTISEGLFCTTGVARCR